MKKRKILFLPYLLVIVFIIISFWLNNPLGNYNQNLNSEGFKKLIQSNEIKSVEFSISRNIITLKGVSVKDKKQSNFQYVLPNTESNIKELTTIFGKQNIVYTSRDAEARNPFLDLLVSLLPMALFIGVGYMILRSINISGGNKQVMDFTKSRANQEKNIKVRFSDVAGCDEEKEEMQEIIEYLRAPQKFEKMGARVPKGVILFGHPGTGKTLLAKAVAGEAKVPFYSVSGSDFMELFVGVGASRVRDMFKVAKNHAPSVIFIDEIDAVGRQRGAGLGGGHDEREQTLNQLLVEMDGIGDNSGIVIIAATNRPDILDSALLRPGRFDRHITVSLPDIKAREAILKVHARNKKIDESVDLNALAKRTPSFSGADLENVLNEAAILAVRDKEDIIRTKHIDEAIDRVMMGPAKKSKQYDEYTKKLVAYHEAGHAIVGLNQEHGTIVQKVTIIPRGSAGGYNLMTPKKERILNTKNDLIEEITCFMGGRCAEEIFFDDITTGASNDIERATNIARDMVTLYGMSELGPIQYDHGVGNVFLGRDYNQSSRVSGQVAFEIDQEVRKIIDSAYNKAKSIILAKKAELVRIAEALIQVETLTGEEINLIYEDKAKIIDGKLVNKAEIKDE